MNFTQPYTMLVAGRLADALALRAAQPESAHVDSLARSSAGAYARLKFFALLVRMSE